MQVNIPFSNLAIELLKRPLLASAFDNHAGKFFLKPNRQVDLHELVNSFLKETGRLDGQINAPAKVDEVLVRLIRDLNRTFLLHFFFVFRLIAIVFVFFV